MSNLGNPTQNPPQSQAARKAREVGKNSASRVVKSRYFIYVDNDKVKIKKQKWVEKRQKKLNGNDTEDFKTNINTEFANTQHLLEFTTESSAFFYQDKNSLNSLRPPIQKSAFLMPYLGKTLNQRSLSSLSRSSRLLALLQIISQVAKLHEQGYNHGDIKPDNIVYNAKTCTFALIDAGCMTPKNHCRNVGTELFMSPLMYQQWQAEQRWLKNNRVGPMPTLSVDLAQEDMWTLGVTSMVILGNWSYEKLETWWSKFPNIRSPFNTARALQTQLARSLTQLIDDRLLNQEPTQRSTAEQLRQSWQQLIKDYYCAVHQQELGDLQRYLNNCHKVVLADIKSRDKQDKKVKRLSKIDNKITKLVDKIAQAQQQLTTIQTNLKDNKDEDLLTYSKKLIEQTEGLCSKFNHIYALLQDARLKKIRGNSLLRPLKAALRYCGFWSGPKSQLTAKGTSHLMQTSAQKIGTVLFS